MYIQTASPLWKRVALFPLLASLLASNTQAININVTYDGPASVGSVPLTDPNGIQLMVAVQAAANYWEDIIEDPGTLTLQVIYDNGISGIGKWTEAAVGGEVGGRPVAGTIHFKGTTKWFYDSTPNNHSEYDMEQSLVRDLMPAVVSATYTGTPPPLLEAYFGGDINGSEPNAPFDATDLFSVALHEIGHALGLSGQLSSCVAETGDLDGPDDFDVNPAHVNGAVFGVIAVTVNGRHTVCPECLLNPSIPPGLRRLPSATDVLALAVCPEPDWNQIDLPRQDFLPGGTSNYTTAGNWVGNQIPGSFDDAFIRHGQQVNLSSNRTVRSLLLEDGSQLLLGAETLSATASITLNGDDDNNTLLEASSNGGINTENLIVTGSVSA